MARPVMMFLMRAAIAAVFIWAAVSKLLDPAAFAVAIDRYEMLPWFGSFSLALYLPWVELLGGLCLLVGKAYRGSLLLLFLLSAMFAVALSLAWMRGLNIDCGCFGGGSGSLHWALLRVAALIAGLLILIASEWSRRGAPTQKSVAYVSISR